MELKIIIPDDRLSEFADMYDRFLKAPDMEIWSVKDIAAYLHKNVSNLYGAQRHLLPPDSIAVIKGKNKKWRKQDVLEHLANVY